VPDLSGEGGGSVIKDTCICGAAFSYESRANFTTDIHKQELQVLEAWLQAHALCREGMRRVVEMKRSAAAPRSEEEEALRQRALALYKPLFTYSRGYVFDSCGEMVADEVGDEVEAGAVLRVRGWGRIGRLAEPEKLQDAVGVLIAEMLSRGWG